MPQTHIPFDPGWRYNGHPNDIYGLHQPYNRGYGVRSPRIDPRKAGANGRFIAPTGTAVHFWIENVEASFQMEGTTGQSKRVRQFFPHNMTQPSITVSGRAPNDYEYNRLAAFVRMTQVVGSNIHEYSALGYLRHLQNSPTPIPTVQFLMGGKQSSITPAYRHRRWLLEGYIKSMEAGAKRHNTAPPFTFEFIIASSRGNHKYGIYSDEGYRALQIQSWMDVFVKQHKGGSGLIDLTDHEASRRPENPSAVGRAVGGVSGNFGL